MPKPDSEKTNAELIEERDKALEQLQGFKDSYHTIQVGWDTEIQKHKDTKEQLQGVHAAEVKAHNETRSQLQAHIEQLRKDHQVAMADAQKAHRQELVKQKQRIDRMEFEAKQAAEIAGA